MNLALPSTYEQRSREQVRKLPSMIPRSKSKKKVESEQVKVEVQTKPEELSTEREEVVKEKQEVQKDTEEKPKDESPQEKEFFPAAMLLSLGGEMEREWPKVIKYEDDEKEVERQENTTKILQETVKDTNWQLFEESTVSEEDNKTEKVSEEESKFQKEYDSTMEEVSDIWKDTVVIIKAIRDHTVAFTEGTNETRDKEYLALEAEMLLLAVDFAINYSKFKMDFLIESLSKRLQVGRFQKSELESFLDFKTFAAFYNEADLKMMAQRVQDLRKCILG